VTVEVSKYTKKVKSKDSLKKKKKIVIKDVLEKKQSFN